LKDPFTIVLSETPAKKLFSGEDPIEMSAFWGIKGSVFHPEKLFFYSIRIMYKGKRQCGTSLF
jgi:hypothetical protein